MRPLIPIIGKYNSYAIAFVNLNDNQEKAVSVVIEDLGLKSKYGYCIMVIDIFIIFTIS